MEQKMIENIEKNTGKTFQEWINIVQTSGKVKHGEIIKFLKTEHGFTHGYANFVAHKAKASDAGSVDNTDDLIQEQYEKKPKLKPIYDKLISAVKEIGGDVELAPKKAYLSLRRKKQFALIQPSTKTRLDVGINLKGIEATDRLENSGSFNAMCSHRVRVTSINEIDDELIDWLKQAYNKA